MSKLKHIAFQLLLMLIMGTTVFAQDFSGYTSMNYAGVNGIDLQPASIVDPRLKFDLNLVGLNFTFFNNYIALKRDGLRPYIDSVKAYNEYVDAGGENNPNLTQVFSPDFQNAMYELQNSDQKNVYLSTTVLGPSFMFPLSPKHSIAFTSALRSKIHLENITPETAKHAWETLDDEDLWGVRIQNENFSFQTMTWAEYGLTYGREVYSNGPHWVSAAVRVKLIQGLMAAYLYGEELDYEFTNDTILSVYASDVQYGHSSNFELDEDNVGYKFIGSPTVGFDIGAEYEWRPNLEKYTYDMDGETGLYRRDKEKYKLKVGFSILDIGSVKYEKGDISGNFTADIRDWDLSDFGLDSAVSSFNDTISDRFGFDPGDKGTFRMALPTSVSFQVDYHIWNDFYVNFTPYWGFRRLNKESKVRNTTTYTLAPRYDYKWFGLAVPFSYLSYGAPRMGLTVRLGPLVAGTDDFTSMFTSDLIYRGNAYMALKFPIPYGKPKDKDKDQVSNRKDRCRNEPGPWEFLGCPDSDGDGITNDEDLCPDTPGPVENSGCPYADRDKDGVYDKDDECPDIAGEAENKGCPYGDKDKDGVLDNVDECIDVPGPEENNGCPYSDKDQDGVLDNEDQCIDTPGPIENNGCPFGDKDGDGVLDSADECIDVPGPADNNGCPFGDRDGDGIKDADDACIDAPGPIENKGCPYLDTDGDGVLDKDDDCPKTPGLKDNKGCPKLEEKEQEIIRTAYDNLEFESGKAVIKQSSLATLKNLADLLNRKETYRLRIAGHTDSVGSDAVNMQLSKARAEAVRDYMVKTGGVANSKFVVEHYGETRPIATNDTPEGRQQNRRVEMNIIFD